MEYTKEEDKKYIENLMSYSFKIKLDNTVWYVIHKNTLRYLKYNKLLNINQKIKFDLTNEILSKEKLKFYIHNCNILFILTKTNKTNILIFDDLYLHFKLKYNNKDFLNIDKYIENIIYDIIKD